jgi:hypothetical protein
MNLCGLNCALAGLGGAQHAQMHHPPSPISSQAHQQHHMDFGSSASTSAPELRSRQCGKPAESAMLAASSKFVPTRNIELKSNFAIKTHLPAITTAGLDFSVFALDSSPPLIAASPQVLIRI